MIEITNEEVIKDLVKLEIGVGILPNWLIEKNSSKHKLVSYPMGRKKVKRDWIVTGPPKHEMTFAESVCQGLIKQATAQIFNLS